MNTHTSKYDNAKATREMREAWNGINYTLVSQRVHVDDVELLTSIAQQLCTERLLAALDGRSIMSREDVAVVLANRSVVKGALTESKWARWKHANRDMAVGDRTKIAEIDDYMLKAKTALAQGTIAENRLRTGSAQSSATIWEAMSGRAYAYVYTMKALSLFTQLCQGVTVKVQHGR